MSCQSALVHVTIGRPTFVAAPLLPDVIDGVVYRALYLMGNIQCVLLVVEHDSCTTYSGGHGCLADVACFGIVAKNSGLAT